MLLGGSPLRLFRISERARQLVERWRAGAPVGPRRPAQLLARRLVSAGAFVPAPGGRRPRLRRRHGRRAGARPSGPARPAARRARRLACVVVDDASADAGATKAIAERHGARFVGLATNVGPAGARNAGLGRGPHPRSWRSSTPTACPTDGWLEPLLGHFDDPLVAAVAPRIVRAGGPARYETARVVARPRRPGGTGAAGEPHPLRTRVRRSSSEPTSRRGPNSSMLRYAAARTWTWSGGWPKPAGTCAMCRRAR